MIYYFSALEIKKCAEFDWSSYFKKDRLYISNGLLTAFNTFDSIILIRQYIFLAVIVVPSKSKVFHFKWQKMDLCLSLRNKKKNSSEEQNGPHAHLVHRRELNASQLEYSGVCVYVNGFFVRNYDYSGKTHEPKQSYGHHKQPYASKISLSVVLLLIFMWN